MVPFLVLGPTQPAIQWVLGVLSLRLEGKADNSFLSSAKVKNECSCTSNPPYAFMVHTGVTLHIPDERYQLTEHLQHTTMILLKETDYHKIFLSSVIRCCAGWCMCVSEQLMPVSQVAQLNIYSTGVLHADLHKLCHFLCKNILMY